MFYGGYANGNASINVVYFSALNTCLWNWKLQLDPKSNEYCWYVQAVMLRFGLAPFFRVNGKWIISLLTCLSNFNVW